MLPPCRLQAEQAAEVSRARMQEVETSLEKATAARDVFADNVARLEASHAQLEAQLAKSSTLLQAESSALKTNMDCRAHAEVLPRPVSHPLLGCVALLACSVCVCQYPCSECLHVLVCCPDMGNMLWTHAASL
jgi:hypothetical protein